MIPESCLPDLKEWLKERGYMLKDSANSHLVLRAIPITAPEEHILQLYQKNHTDQITVPKNHYGLIMEYITERMMGV